MKLLLQATATCAHSIGARNRVLMVLAIAMLFVSMVSVISRDAIAVPNTIQPTSSWKLRVDREIDLEGTGAYDGQWQLREHYEVTYFVESVAGGRATITETGLGEQLETAHGSWTQVISGEQRQTKVDYKLRWVVDLANFRVLAASGSRFISRWVGHQTYFLVDSTRLDVGSTSRLPWVDSNNKIVDVEYRAKERQVVSIGSVSGVAWSLTYDGQSVGYWRLVDGVTHYSTGSATDDIVIDFVNGVLIGGQYAGNFVLARPEGGWTENKRTTTTTMEFDLPIAVQITLDLDPRLVSLTVDGDIVNPTRLPVKFIWILGTMHKLEVMLSDFSQERERAVFVSWSDGFTSANRDFLAGNSMTLVGKLTIQFQLQVSSQFGTTRGSGWYAQGSVATFSVQPTVVRMDGALGVLGGVYRFAGWAGDSASNQEDASIMMDSPKKIVAVWTPDYGLPALAIGSLSVIVLPASFVLVKRRRAVGMIILRTHQRKHLGATAALRGILGLLKSGTTTLLPAKPHVRSSSEIQETEKTDYEDRLARLNELWERGEITEAIYRKLKDEYEERLRSLK